MNDLQSWIELARDDNVVSLPHVPSATIEALPTAEAVNVKAIVKVARQTLKAVREARVALETLPSGQRVTERDTWRTMRIKRHIKPVGFNKSIDTPVRQANTFYSHVDGRLDRPMGLDAYGKYHGERSEAFHFVQSVELARRQAKERRKLEYLASVNKSVGTNKLHVADSVPQVGSKVSWYDNNHPVGLKSTT